MQAPDMTGIVVFAVIGMIACLGIIAGLIYGIWWLFHHVQFV